MPEHEDVCMPPHPGHSRQAWQSARVEMLKKLSANHGKACGLLRWKCVVIAADEDADAEPPYHCHGDGPSQSLGAEIASRCCRGGGDHVDQTVMTFPV